MNNNPKSTSKENCVPHPNYSQKKLSSCYAYHSLWHKFMMSVEWAMPKPAKFSQLCYDFNVIKSFLPNYKGSKWTHLPDLKPTICVTQCSTSTEIPWSEHFFSTRYIMLESVIYCIQQQQMKRGPEWGTNSTRNCGSNQPVKMWKICFWTG